MDRPSQTSEIVPLIVFDPKRRVSAVGLINEKAYKKSIEQNQLWRVDKNTLRVLPADSRPLVSIRRFDGWIEAVCGGDRDSEKPEPVDVEQDAVQPGGTDSLTSTGDSILAELSGVIRRRREERPEGSYTTYLFDEGTEKIRKKIGEEAIELILESERGRIISEAADLVYHLLVLLEAEEIELDELFWELSGRGS